MSEHAGPADRGTEFPIAPAARDRVVDVLTKRFADDEISVEELEVRLERVYQAVTGPQLEAVIADLPVARSSDASVVAVASLPTQRISSLWSGQEQRMTGVVPRRLELRGRMGYIEMDLTQAMFQPGVTEIDVRAFMGYVQIRLPKGIRVECRGNALAGFFSLKGKPASSSGGSTSVVVITGRAMFGFAECFVAGGKEAEQTIYPALDPPP